MLFQAAPPDPTSEGTDTADLTVDSSTVSLH